MRISKGWSGLARVAVALGWVLPPLWANPAWAEAATRAAPVTDTAGALTRRILASSNHRGLPFAVVDKKAATLFVYLGNGTLAGTTPVLLGRAPGDATPPGVGERTQRGQLLDADRTTAAGRYASEPGRNLTGEAVIWIDHANALAIHRLRPGPAHERRAQRITSPNVQDRRISAGCVVVPVAFYDAVVAPVLGRGRGVVYVMAEENSPLAALLERTD